MAFDILYYPQYWLHDDVIKWRQFPHYWPLVTGGFPTQKASDMELWCFLWPGPEQTVEYTIETPVICDAIALIMTLL